MTANLAEIIDQLHAIITAADQAAVQAARAQADAASAYAAYTKIGQGSNHPKLRQAITHARTASEKLGNIARLLAEAANAFTDYVNAIAPGEVPPHTSLPTGMPSGEALVEETADREGRFDSWVRRAAGKGDDLGDGTKETATNIGSGTKAMGKLTRGHIDPQPPGQSTAGTAPAQVRAAQPQTRTSGGDTASALVVSAIALTVAGKAIRRHWRNRKKGNTEAHDAD